MLGDPVSALKVTYLDKRIKPPTSTSNLLKVSQRLVQQVI
jgi:hypothetical protein